MKEEQERERKKKKRNRAVLEVQSKLQESMKNKRGINKGKEREKKKQEVGSI